MSEIAHLAATIFRKAAGRVRYVVAIAGPPGSGKSTLAAALQPLFPEGSAALVQMDGFHFDNAVLDARGLRMRKGAPETFDAAGFAAAVRRLRDGGEVAVPVFDRRADLARAGAAVVAPETRFIIVEGNYLLFDEEPWSRLAPLFDFSVFVEVPPETLEERLIRRWLDHGLAPEAAADRARSNDMINARRILAARKPADIVLGPFEVPG